ncbi:MAG: type II 3-dehydroquinate dehydratase [Polyangiaceae bacterium]
MAASKKTSARRVARATASKRVLVLSGPNLDRLGRREPEIYGRTTLPQVHAGLEPIAAELGYAVDCRQSNHEGVLIDWIGAASDDGFVAILINPGAYTHTSYALHDAIKGCGLPTVELHLSNPDAREAFRRHSCVAPACLGRIAGFGAASYEIALRAVCRHLAARP